MQVDMFGSDAPANLKPVNTVFDPRGETCGEACWYAREEI